MKKEKCKKIYVTMFENTYMNKYIRDNTCTGCLSKHCHTCLWWVWISLPEDASSSSFSDSLSSYRMLTVFQRYMVNTINKTKSSIITSNSWCFTCRNLKFQFFNYYKLIPWICNLILPCWRCGMDSALTWRRPVHSKDIKQVKLIYNIMKTSI